MADTLIHAELLAACSALGYSDGSKYHKEADCLETVKDLLRYLRKDDDSHDIRRAMGETRVLQTDLLPLLRDHSQDDELFDVTLRLLVNLTNPVLLLFREELPEEKVTRQQFLHLLVQQQGYKEAFIEEKVWAVLVGKLGQLLQLDWENRQEEDRLTVERILILVRNILSVPANPEDEKRTDDDASIHDQVLWALHLAGFEDLLLYISLSQNEQDLCMHVLEIISLMLREQDPMQLAQAGLHRSQSQKKKDEQALLEIRRREAIKKQQQQNKYYSVRHSRFGGTYSVQNMKSISDRDLIMHRPVQDLKSLNFDRSKRPKKTPKNRVPMQDTSLTRRSTLAIRLYLQEFCIEFLNGSYNSIMYIVKDNLNRARAQEHDESYYLWAMKFFMEFNRNHQFKVELVSETLSVQTFHYIQTNLENYYEMMTTDKKKIPLWSRRMHKALRAYQELLMTLACMDKSESDSLKESSKVIKSKVFYVVEYREMLLVLLQNYDPIKMSVLYLKDLVETTHIFIKLLEGFCGKSKHIMVQKKTTKKPKQKKSAAGKIIAENQPTEEQLQDQWDEMSAELSAVIQGEMGELPDTVPFDTLSEQTEEEQKEGAMRRINHLLRKKDLQEAVSLMRSSREVWPEGDIFGSENMEASEEFLSLREIYMANLNPPDNRPVAEEEEEEEEEDEEREEENEVCLSEQEFNFLGFVRRFANTKVMMSYARLFKCYSSNSKHTNHCIVRMYHRIAWDCKLPAMFFQASLFCMFLQAMEDPGAKSNESVIEIVRFAKYIIRQFMKVAETNTKVFVELLFWKTNKEALEIECGYGEQTTGKKALERMWKEEEEEELVRLFEEFKGASIEGTDGKDTVDLILENLISQTRTRRMVIKKLKDMSLIADLKDIKRKTVHVRAPRMWTEEEEQELKILFEDNKDAMDIVGRIMDNMIMKRPKHRVIDKILELGLVSDRAELRKKRVKKPKVQVDTRSLGERFVAANQDSDDDDDDDANLGQSSGRSTKAKAPKIWSEEEEADLKHLFEMYKDSADIVGNILEDLAVKRPKVKVIDKIIELGLVSDRKDLYKKRAQKTTQKKLNHGELFLAANPDDDELLPTSESDDSDDSRDASSEESVRSQMTTKSLYTPPVATPSLISGALSSVLEAGMREPVEWLAKILKDVADDREEDGDFEPIPLLAILESCIDAMEDSKFQTLLKLIGLQPPLHLREMFWRIPSRLSVEGLKKRAQYLVQGLSGTLPDNQSVDVPLELAEVHSPLKEENKSQKKKKKNSSSKPKVFKLRKRNKNKKENQFQENLGDAFDDSVPLICGRPKHNEDSSNDDDDDLPLSSLNTNLAPSSGRTKKSAKRSLNHDDDDGEQSQKTSKETKKKRRLQIADDSEEETPVLESHDLKLHLDTELTDAHHQSASEMDLSGYESAQLKEAPKPLRVIDSEESEDDLPLVGGRLRARAIIDSDDE